MKIKKYKTILTRDGYLVNKQFFNNQYIENIKSDLNVIPISYNNKKLCSFLVFKENEDFIAIPKFYGLNKLGKPQKNKEILGENVKFDFNGKLRPLQEEIVNITLDHIDKYDGGGICVGCGIGKTIMGIKISHQLKFTKLTPFLRTSKRSSKQL